MGDATCDECGEQPYLGQLSSKWADTDAEVTVWCECYENVPAVIEPRKKNGRGEPDFWGEEGSRYVCYQCGEIPEMRTSTSMGRSHPQVNYNVVCRCDGLRSFGPTIGWRGVMPDQWKDDADPTKWPDIRDEITEVLEQNGPMGEEEIAEELDVEKEAVHCTTIHMRREDKLFREKDVGYMTPYMMVEHNTGTAPYQQSDEEQHDESAVFRFCKWFKGWA